MDLQLSRFRLLLNFRRVADWFDEAVARVPESLSGSREWARDVEDG